MPYDAISVHGKNYTKSVTLTLQKKFSTQGRKYRIWLGGVLYENKTDQLLNLDRLQLKTVNNVSNWFSRNS